MHKILKELKKLDAQFATEMEESTEKMLKFLDSDTTYGDTNYLADAVNKGKSIAFARANQKIVELIYKIENDPSYATPTEPTTQTPGTTGSRIYNFMEEHNCTVKVMRQLQVHGMDFLRVVNLIKDQPALFILSIGPWPHNQERYWMDLNRKCMDHFSE